MLIFSIILFALGLGTIGYGFILIKNQKQINTRVEEENRILEQKKDALTNQTSLLKNEIEIQKTQLDGYEKQFNIIQNNIKTTIANQQDLSRKAFENYCNVLDRDYSEKMDDYNKHILLLENAYKDKKEELVTQLTKENSELEKIRATRAAAQKAQLKEKEIKEKLSFYCIQLTSADLSDIEKLEDLKPRLNNPRILSMLIWSTFFQKQMNVLCANVIGTEVKSGIYKITNQKDDMCYIGQAVDLARRWKDHAKCGLGIDTPASNKLYAAMIKDGLWNFSFEVLEFCPQAELNEKEKYYIQLYQSYDYGYNLNKGVSK